MNPLIDARTWVFILCFSLLIGMAFSFVLSDDRYEAYGTNIRYYAEGWYHYHTGIIISFDDADTFYNLFFNDTLLSGFTCTDNENLTCNQPGLYSVDFSASGSGQNNHVYLLCIGVNGICQNNSGVHKKMAAGGDVVIMAGTCLLQLNTSDKVTLMINDWLSTGDGIYFASNINLIRIGD